MVPNLQGSKTSEILLRKGEIGDWKHYLDENKWAEFDHAFTEQTKGVAIAEPMKKYM
jgi:hypothetical protein